MKIFLLKKRYLVIGLGLLLAAAMFLAACLPETLAAKKTENDVSIQNTQQTDGE